MTVGREIRLVAPGAATVAVAGDWNGWCGAAEGALDTSRGLMTRRGRDTFVYPLAGRVGPGRHEYKFILDGSWETGGNRVLLVDGEGRVVDPLGLVGDVTIDDVNRIAVLFTRPQDPRVVAASLEPPTRVTLAAWDSGHRRLELATAEPLSLDRPVAVTVTGVEGGPVTRVALPDGVLQRRFGSDLPLGAGPDPSGGIRFRLFAPRARSVELLLHEPPALDDSPSRILPLTREEGGTWSGVAEGPGPGWGYRYRVTGPGAEEVEGPRLVVDPYAAASRNHGGPGLLVSSPGPPRPFTPPPRQDLVICELHVRDYTVHPASGVPLALRGRYGGLASDRPLSHLRRMGFNAVELLPVAEFDEEPPGAYHWGYMPSLFMAPESSYASDPRGVAVREFKDLVDSLHERGFAVILDVVVNHTGAPHHLAAIDRAYYHRRDAFGVWSNVSGCGNDLRTESPMARRLIVDACRHWLHAYGVDGFRFDLAHLIDRETLSEIAVMAEEEKPGAILIAEPWSFGGNNKAELGADPAWSCWNDDFRNRVRDFVAGKLDRDDLVPVLSGSTSLWASTPLSSVNYVESHDDLTLVDHLSGRPDHDGRHPSVREIRRNRMVHLMLLTAPGIPMLAQGQELLRSKGGCGNSYDRGDAVNAVPWDRLEACAGQVGYLRALIHLRSSPSGVTFRRRSRVPGDQWPLVLPRGRHPHAVGVRMEGPPDYLLLLNAHERSTVEFDLPPGVWAGVADLDHVAEDPVRSVTYRRRMSLRPLDGRLLRLLSE